MSQETEKQKTKISVKCFLTWLICVNKKFMEKSRVFFLFLSIDKVVYRANGVYNIFHIELWRKKRNNEVIEEYLWITLE